MYNDIYIFDDLPENWLTELSCAMSTISNGNRTIVFIDDFASLPEDLQEDLLEFNPIEVN